MEYWQKYNEKEEEIERDKDKTIRNRIACMGGHLYKTTSMVFPNHQLLCHAQPQLVRLFFSIFGPSLHFLATLGW